MNKSFFVGLSILVLVCGGVCMAVGSPAAASPAIVASGAVVASSHNYQIVLEKVATDVDCYVLTPANRDAAPSLSCVRK